MNAPAQTDPPRAEITVETINKAVIVNDAVYYQPDEGPKQLLASAEEIGKIDRHAWIRARKQEMGIGGPF